MTDPNAILDEIKSSPHWRLQFRPVGFDEQRIPTVTACREIVEKSTVSLRGWDFPHYDRDARAMGNDWISSTTEFMNHHEYWKFFQSGQFVFLRRFKDDFDLDGAFLQARFEGVPIPLEFTPSGYASIVEMLYLLTEFLDFSAHIAARISQNEEVQLDVSMLDVARRVLYLDRQSSRTFYQFLHASTDDLTWQKKVTCSRLVAEHDEIAITATGHLLERFSWPDWSKSMDLLRNEQTHLRNLFRHQ